MNYKMLYRLETPNFLCMYLHVSLYLDKINEPVYAKTNDKMVCVLICLSTIQVTSRPLMCSECAALDDNIFIKASKTA